MSKTVHRPDSANVNVTLDHTESHENALFGKRFPCCLCGAGLEICFSRKRKPYTTCLRCGIQTFFRGKAGIRRLTEIVNSELLIAGTGSKTELAVILFNRIQQLRAQKGELEGKQGLILRDPDLTNAIRAVDNEIERAQIELAKLGRKTPREKTK
jgi:hypothetical protein